MSDPRAVEAFLYHEADLLDSGRYEEWFDLLTEDATYWVPASPGQPDPFDHVSLFYEDRTLLAMRIARLRHPQAHALAVPIRTSRVVGNVVAGAPSGGEVTVRARFQLVERQGDRQRLFAGATTHRLVPRPGGFAIRGKRIDLIDCDGLHEALQIIL